MKTWIVAIVMFVLCVSNAQAADPNDGLTLWGCAADGADALMGVRVGWVADKVELFGTAKWFTYEPDWGPEPTAVGGGIIFHVNEFAQVTDPAPDSGWEEILHSFVGRPYAGLEFLLPVDGPGRTPKINWLLGTLLSTSTDMKQSLVVEYATGQGIAEDAEQIVTFGLRIRF